MAGQVEILFPIFEVNDPSTRAWFVDGGSNQASGPGPFENTYAPGAQPHQIGADVILVPTPPPTFLYFEATIVDTGPEMTACIGLAGTGFQIADPWRLDVTGNGPTCADGLWWGCGVANTGGQARGYPNQPQIMSANPGDVVGLAVDLPTQQVWIVDVTANPDQWYGGNICTTADVIAKTHGFTFGPGGGSPITGNIYILGGAGFDTLAPHEVWTFSNGNQTLTNLLGSENCAIGITSHSSGKWYAEFTASNHGDWSMGFASAIAYSNRVGGTAATSIGWNTNGSQPWLYNNSFVGSTAAPTPSGGNITIGLAADLDNGLYWVNVNGTFYGNGVGNPTTGTNGFPATIGAPAFLAISSNGNGVADISMNPVSGNAPSGFSDWGADEFNFSFVQHQRYASVILNTGRRPFIGTPPGTASPWDITGNTTFNPSDNAGLVLGTGNLQLVGNFSPLGNQSSNFVRSTTSKAIP